MKTLIAIPCMDMVATGFCQSLAMLRKVGEVAVTHVSSSLIYDSRNKIAVKAIELGCDFVMWFDSDMIFNPDTMERLIAHMEDKDIVSGLYFRRSGKYTPVMYKTLDLHEDGAIIVEDYIDYPKDGPFKVAGIGFGCVLMKTSVLVDMAATYGTWFTPNGRVGEDLSFCLRASELGYDIWVDPSIKCGHVGSIIVNEDFFNAIEQSKTIMAEAKHESKS